MHPMRSAISLLNTSLWPNQVFFLPLQSLLPPTRSLFLFPIIIPLPPVKAPAISKHLV